MGIKVRTANLRLKPFTPDTWRNRRYCFTIIALLALGGCRIELSVVPAEGGTIETASGNHSCTAANCPQVVVDNLLFDETFIATPNPGFEFERWVRKQRSFCGNRTDPSCRLFTAGFAGNDQLLAFLDNDGQVFFLEAQFREISGTGTGNAAACFNEALITPGTTVVTVYDAIDDGVSQTVESDRVVFGGESYNGETNLLRAEENLVIETDEGTLTSTVNLYSRYLPGFNRVRSYGSVAVTDPPFASEIEVRLDPFSLFRFDLSAGDRFTDSYNSEVITNAGGQQLSDSLSIEAETTFLGIESVTVPAGTFDACHYREVSEATPTGFPFSTETTSDSWYAVGNGILLKQEDSEGNSTELLEASINGADI